MSKWKLLGALVLGLMLLVLPDIAAGQGTGRITGTVTDSALGRGLSNAQISVSGVRTRSETDEQGRYTVVGVPAGTYTVEARRIGYRRGVVTNVVVTEGGTATANIALVTAPLTLEAVVTTGVVDPTSGTRVPFTSHVSMRRTRQCRPQTRSRRYRARCRG